MKVDKIHYSAAKVRILSPQRRFDLTWLVLIIPVTFSEAIALEIESNTKYLYAQLYTGLIYIASAVCLWFVRAWKIGQLEQLAAA